jgi:hypothetical protein
LSSLLQLAPSYGSLADSCRSGELKGVSNVIVQCGPLVYGKSAECKFVQWGPHVYDKARSMFWSAMRASSNKSDNNEVYWSWSS